MAMGGTDTGPKSTRVSSFVTGGLHFREARIAANQKRINLRSLALRVEGTIGTEELLGKNCDKRAGFPGIDVEANIDADI